MERWKSGFGSTETVTSQSNQSVVSSCANGRKSRADLTSNSTPESLEAQQHNKDQEDSLGVNKSNTFLSFEEPLEFAESKDKTHQSEFLSDDVSRIKLNNDKSLV